MLGWTNTKRVTLTLNQASAKINPAIPEASREVIMETRRWFHDTTFYAANGGSDLTVVFVDVFFSYCSESVGFIGDVVTQVLGDCSSVMLGKF
jgi:hypothetical protein